MLAQISFTSSYVLKGAAAHIEGPEVGSHHRTSTYFTYDRVKYLSDDYSDGIVQVRKRDKTTWLGPACQLGSVQGYVRDQDRDTREAHLEGDPSVKPIVPSSKMGNDPLSSLSLAACYPNLCEAIFLEGYSERTLGAPTILSEPLYLVPQTRTRCVRRLGLGFCSKRD